MREVLQRSRHIREERHAMRYVTQCRCFTRLRREAGYFSMIYAAASHASRRFSAAAPFSECCLRYAAALPAPVEPISFRSAPTSRHFAATPEARLCFLMLLCRGEPRRSSPRRAEQARCHGISRCFFAAERHRFHVAYFMSRRFLPPYFLRSSRHRARRHMSPLIEPAFSPPLRGVAAAAGADPTHVTPATAIDSHAGGTSSIFARLTCCQRLRHQSRHRRRHARFLLCEDLP